MKAGFIPGVLFLLLFAPSMAFTADVLHLKSGEIIPCEIEAITDNIVTFSFQVPGNTSGSAKRTIPAEQVAHVEFGFETGEKAAFSQREEMSSGELQKWWDFHFAHLHRPRARTAAWGIALGNALLREDPESEGKTALALFDRIAARAWSQADVDLARQGRLRSLIALGDLETAMAEPQPKV